MAGYKLLIIDKLGLVSLSKTGAELFELILLRYECGATSSPANFPSTNRAKRWDPSVPPARCSIASPNHQHRRDER